MAVVLAGCAVGHKSADPRESPTQSIYLVRFGWHADLVVPNDPCRPLPDVAPPELRNATFVAVGWGDADFFPLERPGLGATLKAALVPGPSVYQILPVAGNVERRFRSQQILRIELSDASCRRLGDFIRERFVVTDSAFVPVETDRHTAARYYLSTERYHLLHNCNHWTAKALGAAGLPIWPALTPTVTLLWQEARKHAGTISHLPLSTLNPPSAQSPTARSSSTPGLPA
ncbi:MAG TPA: DUF2459 domain-containing protein [Rhodothermales bacterium]